MFAALALAALATGCGDKPTDLLDPGVALSGPTSVVAVGGVERVPPRVVSALLPAPADYRLAQGRILVRLSSRLSPAAADRYAAVLSRLRG